MFYSTIRCTLLIGGLFFFFHISKAADWYVNDLSTVNDIYTSAAGDFPSPSGTADGSSSAPFNRISDAVNAASDGDVIYVDAGNYILTGNFALTKELTFIGRYAGEPFNAAVRTGQESRLSGNFGYRLQHDNISFDGFFFRSLRTSGAVIASTTAFNTGFTLTNSIIRNDADADHAVRINEPFTQSSIEISDCFIDGMTEGVVLQSVDNVHILRNRFFENADVSVFADDVQNADLSQNSLEAGAVLGDQYGFVLSNGSGGLLENILIAENEMTGDFSEGVRIGEPDISIFPNEVTGLFEVRNNIIDITGGASNYCVGIYNGSFSLYGTLIFERNKFDTDDLIDFYIGENILTPNAEFTAYLNSWSDGTPTAVTSISSASLLPIDNDPRFEIWLSSDTDADPAAPGFQPVFEAEIDEDALASGGKLASLQFAVDYLNPSELWTLHLDDHTNLASQDLTIIKNFRIDTDGTPPEINSLSLDANITLTMLDDLLILSSISLNSGVVNNTSGELLPASGIPSGATVTRINGRLQNAFSGTFIGVNYIYEGGPYTDFNELPASASHLGSITLDMPAGNSIVLPDHLTLRNALNFNAPNFMDLNGFNLNLLPTAFITGTTGTGAHIIADDGIGEVIKEEITSGGGTFNFPVGDGTHYLPVTAVNSGTAASDLSVRVGIPLSSQPDIGADLVTDYLDKTWVVEGDPSALASPDFFLTFKWDPALVTGGPLTSAQSVLFADDTSPDFYNHDAFLGTSITHNLGSYTSPRLYGVLHRDITVPSTWSATNCAGDVGDLVFTSMSDFLPGNQFIIELSDETGSFTSPTPVGMLSWSGSAPTDHTVSCTVPADIPSGSSYRVRVRSTNPVIIGDESPPVTINSCINAPATIPTILCPGADFDISVMTGGVFDPGNVFSVHFSNDGFLTSTTIGSLTWDGAGAVTHTIPVTIPTTAPTGTGYRIRVESSVPGVVGADNGTDLTVAPSSVVIDDVTVSPLSFCGFPSGSITIQLLSPAPGAHEIDLNDDGVYDFTRFPNASGQLEIGFLPEVTIPVVHVKGPGGCVTSYSIGAPYIIEAPLTGLLDGTLIQPTDCGDTTGLGIITKADTGFGVFHIDLNNDGIWDLENRIGIGDKIFVTDIPHGMPIGPQITVTNAFSGCGSDTLDIGTVLYVMPKYFPDTTLSVTAEPELVSPGFSSVISVHNIEDSTNYYLVQVGASPPIVGGPYSGAEGSTINMPTPPVNDTTYFVVAAQNADECSNLMEEYARVDVIHGLLPDDSLILVELYNATCGPDWVNSWVLTQPVSTWAGVSYFAGRVTSLNLSGRGLCNTVPVSVSALPMLKSLTIDNNALDFASVEMFVPLGLDLFKYAPQDSVNVKLDTSVVQRESIALPISVGGVYNQYKWFRNGEEIPGSNAAPYLLENARLEDKGVYTCEITNVTAPDLTLHRKVINVDVVESINPYDSLALVNIYNSCGGDSWSVFWNRSDLVRNWPGVEVRSGRVFRLDLASVGLTGELPDIFGGENEVFSEIIYLNLFGNRLSGTVPASFGELDKLQVLDLEKNAFERIPLAFFDAESLRTLSLARNNFNEIPEAIKNLEQLENLYLQYNKLSSLPPGIGELNELRILDVSRNKLEELPVSFSSLTKLERFYTGYNLLEELPSVFTLMTSLKDFKAEANSLDELPGSLTIPPLLHLNLSQNRLDFGDLEPYHETENFFYTPQGRINTAYDTVVSKGDDFSALTIAGGTADHCTWYKSDKPDDPISREASLLISEVELTHTGEYYALVRNSFLPDLVLRRRTVSLFVECSGALEANLKAITPTLFCGEDPVNAVLEITNFKDGEVQWFYNTQRIYGETETSLIVVREGTYRARISDAEGCAFFTDSIEVIRAPKPNAAVTAAENLFIAQEQNTAEHTYQWYRNGEPIPGAVDIVFEAAESGVYFLEITSVNGCYARSASINYDILGFDKELEVQTRLFPNPSTGRFRLQINKPVLKAPIFGIVDGTGRNIPFSFHKAAPDVYNFSVKASSGVFFIKINIGNSWAVKKMIFY